MAEPRLSPTELDRLEDALEDLEFAEDIDDPSSVVAARLADYQLILSASREAFTLEDVPDGALASVLREAGMPAEDTVSSVRTEAAKRPGFWARLRKSFLVPTLAVAGSAALVLLIVRPSMDDAAAPTAEPGMAGPSSKTAAAAADAAEESVAEAKDASAAPPPPPPTTAAPAKADKDLSELKSELTRSTATATRTPGAVTKAEPASEPEPAAANSPKPMEEPESVEDKKSAGVSASGWDAVERGDKARTGGDCFTARNHYARALDDGNDSVRARAFAGLGLCKKKDGEDAAAAEFFERARELDPEADDYAGTQQSERKAKPSPSRPKRKRASKKQEMDALDPFK